MLQPHICHAVEKYFSFVLNQGVNWSPEHLVPPDMRLGEVDVEEQLVAWKPIPSTVAAGDIAKVEHALSARLSPQFVDLLSYKHFMELHLGDMWFFAHPSRGWEDVLTDHVFRGHPRELLVDKGFLPFAAWADWGLYCFSLGERNSDGEYAVYQWDHDDPHKFSAVGDSFNDAVVAAMSRDA